MCNRDRGQDVCSEAVKQQPASLIITDADDGRFQDDFIQLMKASFSDPHNLMMSIQPI